jgi:hypothetical protein
MHYVILMVPTHIFAEATCGAYDGQSRAQRSDVDDRRVIDQGMLCVIPVAISCAGGAWL